MLRVIPLLLLLSLGCASTKVYKNPGPDDHGIRYYRPKPYLLIQPATIEENKLSKEFVKISLEYLPDYSEEYSIHINAGIGINNTTVKLENGWKLTDINVNIDSQFNENLQALGSLLSSIPKGAFSPGQSSSGISLKANNVPFGYYEAVISMDSCGVKRLYGWRYVGFYPYATCPMESGGFQCTNCESEVIYALSFEKGVMTFTALPSLRGKEPVIDPSSHGK